MRPTKLLLIVFVYTATMLFVTKASYAAKYNYTCPSHKDIVASQCANEKQECCWKVAKWQGIGGNKVLGRDRVEVRNKFYNTLRFRHGYVIACHYKSNYSNNQQQTNVLYMISAHGKCKKIGQYQVACTHKARTLPACL